MTDYLVNNFNICLQRISLNYTNMNVYTYKEINDM